MNNIVVIGAGMSGLTAARELHQQGFSVVTLEKGRGVGGRMTTRSLRIEGFGDAIGDRGAQFFTAREPKFIELVELMLKESIIREWIAQKTNPPRYIGKQGMREITNFLARGLDVRTEQTVISLKASESGWITETDAGLQFESDLVVLSLPIPQSLQLIQASRITLDKPIKTQLESIQYRSCLTLMVLLETDSKVTGEGFELGGDIIRWIADNKQKGISNLPVLTIHSTDNFSKKYWQASDGKIAEEMLSVAKPFLGSDVLMYKVHRWRYSEPETIFPEQSLLIQKPHPLVMCGDGFVEGRIEGAYLSGLHAATLILGQR